MVTADLVRSIVAEEVAELRAGRPASGRDRAAAAAELFERHALAEELPTSSPSTRTPGTW